ncbi:DUF1036 domain-containing protein [Rippkaea orientalis]|nr:DUF1036 domain-containing protein [Rippkaea orientalis]
MPTKSINQKLLTLDSFGVLGENPMKNKLLLLLGIIAAVGSQVTIGTQKAIAGEICNNINDMIFISAAQMNNNDVWVSKGWWEVEPGACLSYPDDWYAFVQVNRDHHVPLFEGRPHQIVLAPVGRQWQEWQNSEENKPPIESVKLCVVQDKYTAYSAKDGALCDRDDYGFSDNSMQTFYATKAERFVVRSFSREELESLKAQNDSL